MIFGTVVLNDAWKRGYRAGVPQYGPADLLGTFPPDHTTLPEDERPANLDQYYGAILTLDWTLQPLARAPSDPNRALVVVIGDEDVFLDWNQNQGGGLVTLVDEADMDSYSAWTQEVHARGAGGNPKQKWESRLALRRAYYHRRIDQKTTELIDNGFEFPAGSGQVFSLSHAAQLTWLGMFQSRAALTYPVLVSTKDSMSTVSLADASDVEDFYTAGVLATRAALDTGTALKATINSAQTEVALEGVEDNR